ncbi:hypothetical protein [Streptomyces sp. WAC04657]|uniref:hypothetical protein n=1 Tax=Streptomyces sp. WAC04657 TaxID=1779145 RepID=UPI000AF86123|nr:hypothetical protein [Streptomyces sp. WAC04657]
MSAEAANPVSAAEDAAADTTVRRRGRARIDLRRLGRAALLGATAGPAPATGCPTPSATSPRRTAPTTPRPT